MNTTLISAHRAAALESGFAEGSRASLEYAASLEVDFIEFDVHRFECGTFFLSHDAVVEAGGRRVDTREITADQARSMGMEVVEVSEAVSIITEAGKSCHVDFKFCTPETLRHAEKCWEVDCAEEILAVCDPGDAIFTTMEDPSLTALSKRYAKQYPQMLLGLSLGRDVDWRGDLLGAAKVRLTEIFPGRRMRRCGATLVVAKKTLAHPWIAAWARVRQFPLLVWTVDDSQGQKRWMSSPHCWMMTTNRPSQAIEMRSQSTPS